MMVISLKIRKITILKLYDLLSTLISLLSTYYFTRLDSKAWVIGIFATFLNGWLYWEKGIYADMFLQLFYLMSLIYGWYQWTTVETPKTNTIKFLSLKNTIALGFGIGCLYFFILWLLRNYSSSSSVAQIDALTTSLSIVAQCLICYKVITTWIIWFIADTLYAGLYFSKNLPSHALLAIFYAGLAIRGYLHWRQEYTLSSNFTHLPEASNPPRDVPMV